MISKNQFKYIRQLEQKKYRRREGLFVAEGTKVVGDLIQRYQPKAIYATHEYLRAFPLLSKEGLGNDLACTIRLPWHHLSALC